MIHTKLRDLPIALSGFISGALYIIAANKQNMKIEDFILNVIFVYILHIIFANFMVALISALVLPSRILIDDKFIYLSYLTKEGKLKSSCAVVHEVDSLNKIYTLDIHYGKGKVLNLIVKLIN